VFKKPGNGTSETQVMTRVLGGAKKWGRKSEEQLQTGGGKRSVRTEHKPSVGPNGKKENAWEEKEPGGGRERGLPFTMQNQAGFKLKRETQLVRLKKRGRSRGIQKRNSGQVEKKQDRI